VCPFFPFYNRVGGLDWGFDRSSIKAKDTFRARSIPSKLLLPRPIL
jgi:hypothetical protein